MLPFFVTVTLFCAQISAEASPNYLIPNAYYSGNGLGYANTWYSYNGQPSYVYPQQPQQYNQNYQYRSINSYQPPFEQQIPYTTQSKPVKNDPYAANPHVSLLKPSIYHAYSGSQYATVTQNYIQATAKPYIETETAEPVTAKPYVAPVTAKPYVPVTAKPYVPVTAKPYVAPVTAKPVKPITAKPYVAPVTAKPFKAIQAVPEPTKLVQEPRVNKNQGGLVLDFSSGEAKEVENTATKVEKVDTIETTNGFEVLTKGYEKLGLEQELSDIGNITIFAPRDEDFEKAGIDIDNLDKQILRQIILKHLVKGTLERKDLKAGGTVMTLAGVPITLTKNEKGKLIIVSNGQTTKLKITNVRTKWGIVHVIDSVLA